MNIDKSYGVDNLMLSKEQRFLILEMIADRELLEQAIGSRGYDKFKFDGLNKIDDTIRNRIATLKFYFPEEFHMLNQELLGIFDNSLQRELGYNKAHICIKKEFNFDGFISEWVAWTKQIARTPLKSFQSNLHKHTETERSWVQTFQDIIKCFDKSDERLWSVVESLWRDTLTPFDTDGIYDKFGLLVSLGDGQFTSNRYPIISSSLITDEFNYTYQSEFRRIGWCFSLNPYRVIGMSPEDTTSAKGGSPIPRYLDAAEINLASKSFISLEKSVIQFRTKLQHIWATAVEMMGIFTKSKLKASIGDEDILRFFVLVSSLFAKLEETPICPHTIGDNDAIVQEIKKIDNKIKLVRQIHYTLDKFTIRLDLYGMKLSIIWMN